MSLTEPIDIYGPCTAKFELSIQNTNELLKVLGTFSRDFAIGTKTQVLFEGLLANFLKLTNSEYGFENCGFLTLLDRADKSLYAAKNQGRNQVCSSCQKPEVNAPGDTKTTV